MKQSIKKISDKMAANLAGRKDVVWMVYHEDKEILIGGVDSVNITREPNGIFVISLE